MERTDRDETQSITPVFLVNPASHSGKGKRIWDRVEKQLHARGLSYEVFFSKGPGDIARLAKAHSDAGLLVVLGGDGTVNEALQGILDFSRVRLGYIPTGSGNDLARNLGIVENPEEALDRVIAPRREMYLDVGSVSWREKDGQKQRRFLVSCGMGYDAAVCRMVDSFDLKETLNRIGLGRLAYLGIGLRQMFTADYVKTEILLEDGKILDLERMLFAVSMSHRYEGGGFCFCPQADPEDGLFDLCVVNGVPRWKFPIIIPFARKGRHGIFSGVGLYRARQIKIQASSPLWIHTDGEVPAKTDRIVIRMEEQKLHFIV